MILMKYNLLTPQVSCSDVRERFHLFALLFVVVVQTMKEYGWREDSFWSLVGVLVPGLPRHSALGSHKEHMRVWPWASA